MVRVRVWVRVKVRIRVSVKVRVSFSVCKSTSGLHCDLPRPRLVRSISIAVAIFAEQRPNDVNRRPTYTQRNHFYYRVTLC